MMLRVCRDIVGNTICADFLDYLYRDWHHIGKPLYKDERLYQYMEVRRPSGAGGADPARFVINVGPSDKIRHDALTDILELLNARYKLAETVLFHRTKLALTGVLDRCLLEISEIYRIAGLSSLVFSSTAEKLLLQGSDDALPEILNSLVGGGTAEAEQKIKVQLKVEREKVQAAVVGKGKEVEPLLTASQTSMDETETGGELQRRSDLAKLLIGRLHDREVYTMVYKMGWSELPGAHTPENDHVKKLLRLYGQPKNRLEFLEKVESLCLLPPGSLIMYCPHDARMNAKVAEVNLYVEGEVSAFDAYEKTHAGASLTGRALEAQIARFYELWGAQVYVERTCWDGMADTARGHLRSVLREFFFQINHGYSVDVVRTQIEPSIEIIKKAMKAARSGSSDPEQHEFRDFVFPSGMPFFAK